MSRRRWAVRAITPGGGVREWTGEVRSRVMGVRQILETIAYDLTDTLDGVDRIVVVVHPRGEGDGDE